MKLYTLKLSKLPTIKRPRSESGFSAVDFLIGVAAVGVLLLLTWPGISTMQQNYYIDNTVSELASSLTLAKNESDRWHTMIRICPSADGYTCHQIGDWNRGWLVFSDSNEDGIPQNSERIRAYGPPGKKVHIMSYGAFSDSPGISVATGLTSARQLHEGEFSVCSPTGAISRSKVVVNPDGEVNLEENDRDECTL